MFDPNATPGAEDIAIAAAASKVTYTGAGTVGLGWLFSNEAAVVAGFLIGLAGLLVNWYYKAKADRRLTREHEARMVRLRAGYSTDTDAMELDE